MQQFIIRGRLSSLNEYTLKCRGNYGQYGGNQLKKQNENLVKRAISHADLKEVTKYPVKIEYKWIEANKKRDKDNIAFAHKFIQDALVNMCILENDTWKYIECFSDDFDVDKDDPRVEVTIKEFGEY
jgi:Holliday junction resolvase RusA-like endonuclease